MSNGQNSQVAAAQLRAQEAASYNQAMSAGMAEQMRNAAPPPEWKSLAEEALELLIVYKQRALYWRGWALAGFGYVAVDVALKVWGMFR